MVLEIIFECVSEIETHLLMALSVVKYKQWKILQIGTELFMALWIKKERQQMDIIVQLSKLQMCTS